MSCWNDGISVRFPTGGCTFHFSFRTVEMIFVAIVDMYTCVCCGLQTWQQRNRRWCVWQCVGSRPRVSLECPARELENPVCVTGLSGPSGTTSASTTAVFSLTPTLAPASSITPTSSTGERRRQHWRMGRWPSRSVF